MRMHLMPTHYMHLHVMPMHATVPGMSDAAEQTLVAEWRELLARHAVVSGALETELQRQHGIGVSEFEALEQIATCGEGKCRAARLSDAVHLSQSAASRLVARLERAGLVQRAMCEMDRRGIFVTLTEEGHRRYTEARPTHRAVLAGTLGAAATEAAVRAAPCGNEPAPDIA
jgi:DNA-binding MarR family transcriptional regulator